MINKLIFSLYFLLVIFYSNAQGQIISITIDPPSPTTADSVTVYVDLQFSSGGCAPDSQSHSTNGNNTSATSHHCLGMLTVICPYTDTFELGYLQAGVHQFDFILTSGGGPSPCTPGIVPDDQDTLIFTVGPGVGISESFLDNSIQIFPNPTVNSITLILNQEMLDENTTVNITDASGRILKTFKSIQNSKIVWNEMDLPAGIYFVEVLNGNRILSKEKFMVLK